MANVCPSYKANGQPCSNQIKPGFGVCGVHKKNAYLVDSPQFRVAFETFKILVNRIAAESDRLEAAGIDILNVQSAWSNNLCGPVVRDHHQHFRVLGPLLEQFKTMMGDISSQYGIAGHNACLICYTRAFNPVNCERSQRIWYRLPVV